jgi:hypothetical protein
MEKDEQYISASINSWYSRYLLIRYVGCCPVLSPENFVLFVEITT